MSYVMSHSLKEWLHIFKNDTEIGNFQRAAEIKKAINAGISNEILYSNLSDFVICALKNNELATAKMFVTWLIELYPNDFNANIMLATVNDKMEGHAVALHTFNKFITNAPSLIYKKAMLENRIHLGILLSFEKGINDFNLGFMLPDGHTETQHLTNHPKYTEEFLLPTKDIQNRIASLDIIFNIISDPDIYAETLQYLAKILNKYKIPIINHPKLVLKNTRDNLYYLLKDLPEVVIPKTIRLKINSTDDFSSLISAINKHGIVYPFLIRPIGSQTGYELYRIKSDSDMKQYTIKSKEVYITQYYDFQSSDGYYRKYRCWCIGDQILPNHLFIDVHWNVHGHHSRTYTMLNNKWMLDEEQSFLQNFTNNNKNNLLGFIKNIKSLIGLDYFGVDFSFLPDGHIILFEANATMRSFYPEWVADFPYIINTLQKQTLLFQELINNKLKLTDQR